MSEPPILVWQAWEKHAQQDPSREAIVHWDVLEGPTRWTRGELLNRAAEYAAKLLEAGANTADVCAIILRHNKDFYPIYLGRRGNRRFADRARVPERASSSEKI